MVFKTLVEKRLQRYIHLTHPISNFEYIIFKPFQSFPILQVEQLVLLLSEFQMILLLQ